MHLCATFWFELADCARNVTFFRNRGGGGRGGRGGVYRTAKLICESQCCCSAFLPQQHFPHWQTRKQVRGRLNLGWHFLSDGFIELLRARTHGYRSYYYKILWVFTMKTPAPETCLTVSLHKTPTGSCNISFCRKKRERRWVDGWFT